MLEVGDTVGVTMVDGSGCDAGERGAGKESGV